MRLPERSIRVYYLKCHMYIMLVSQLQNTAEYTIGILSELNVLLWTNTKTAHGFGISSSHIIM